MKALYFLIRLISTSIVLWGLNYSESITLDLIFSTLLLNFLMTEICVIRSIKIVLKNRFKKINVFVFFYIGTYLSFWLSFILNLPSYFSTDPQYVFSGRYTITDPNILVANIYIFLIVILALFFEKSLYFKIHNFKIDPLILKSKTKIFALAILFFLIKIYLISGEIVGYKSFGLDSEKKFSFVTQFINVFNDILFVSVLLIMFNPRFRIKKRYLLYLFSCFILEFSTGYKEAVIVIFIQLILIFLIYNRTKLFRLTLSLSIVILIFIYPFMNSYRFHRDYGNSVLTSLLITFPNNNLPLVNNDFTLFDRYSNYNLLLFAIDYESEWSEYKHLNRYKYLPLFFVPRALLPNKPTHFGNTLYKKFTNSDNTTTSITPSTFGWSYFEGGIVIGIFSFLLYFIVLRSISIYFMKSNYYVIFFLMIGPSLLKIESDIYYRINALLILTFIFIFYKTFVTGKFEKV